MLGSQPVAWAVIEWDGDVFGTYRTEEDARQVIEYFSYDGMHAAPLYRHPQPTLTGEEREAIGKVLRRVREDYFAGRFADSVKIAAVIDGLLERTK